MATLLIELGCEELPAAACREAERQLPDLARSVLGIEPTRVLVTARRLAVLVEDVPEQTADQWVKGPPVAMRDKAAAGFAKRHGVAVEELEERDGFLGVAVAGKPVAEVLPGQVEELVRGLSFSKTMRWDESGLRFPRPARWRLAMLNATRIVGERSYGHRFSSGPIEIADAAGYADALRAAHVEPDSEERRRQIVGGLDGLGGWTDPHGVLAEVVYLVESPVVLDCSFDERYLQLPSRVVETTIQHHIRAFPLGGNRFAFVANGGDPDTVRGGVENVVGGRLEDASFTFERDVKVGIDALADRLGAITFFHGAGSFADKTGRLAKLVEALGGGEAALEAARLAKADQASELVREFPELEGHVGAEYARLAGYPEAVSAAIDEQYLPDAADAPLPTTETGRVLSAADKIDTLNVSFGLGTAADGLARSLRAAARGDRPRPARDRGQPLDPPRADGPGGRGVRRGALRGPARGAGRVRARRPPRSGARPRRRGPAGGGPRGAPGRAARPDPHGVHAREPARREGAGRCRGARARAARRRRRGQRSPRRSSASTRRSRRRSTRATSTRRSRRAPSSARSSTGSSRTCSSWPTTEPCAQTVCASS